MGKIYGPFMKWEGKVKSRRKIITILRILRRFLQVQKEKRIKNLTVRITYEISSPDEDENGE